MRRATALAVSFVLLALSATFTLAKDTWVRGYVRKDGTYVQGHYRSAPDGNFWNNYSANGNVNPYTGKKGYKLPPPGYGSDVWVNGYFRADGTYVPGYWRSAPDGNLWNNFSTWGNTNPYTGELGTRLPDTRPGTSPRTMIPLPQTDRPSWQLPAVPSYSSNYSSWEASSRARIASELAQEFGVHVDASSRSWLELSDLQSRYRKAREVKQELGVTLDPNAHSWLEMSDMLSRHRKAAEVRRELGLTLDPSRYSWLEMSDLQNRHRKARELKREFGLDLDPNRHSWLDMQDLQSRYQAAARIKRNLGIQLDPKSYTWLELNEIERRGQR